MLLKWQSKCLLDTITAWFVQLHHECLQSLSLNKCNTDEPERKQMSRREKHWTVRLIVSLVIRKKYY